MRCTERREWVNPPVTFPPDASYAQLAVGRNAAFEAPQTGAWTRRNLPRPGPSLRTGHLRSRIYADGTLASGPVSLLAPTRPEERCGSTRSSTSPASTSPASNLATRSTIGTLVEDGKPQLHSPLVTFWPQVTGHPLAQVTARGLLPRVSPSARLHAS